MSELFVVQFPEGDFLDSNYFDLDYPPEAYSTTHSSNPLFLKRYVMIRVINSQTKYRMYFVGEDEVQLTSEDNKHLIQSDDGLHNYFASLFKVENVGGGDGILKRDDTFDVDDVEYAGLQQNELVVSGQDLFFPFKVVGGADAINLFRLAADAEYNAYQNEQENQEEEVLPHSTDSPNAPTPLQEMKLRF